MKKREIVWGDHWGDPSHHDVVHVAENGSAWAAGEHRPGAWEA